MEYTRVDDHPRQLNYAEEIARGSAIAIVTDPSNGSVAINENGILYNTSDDGITYTPDANFNVSDSFTCQIEDSNGNTSTATVYLTVNADNDQPTTSDDSIRIDQLKGAEPISNAGFLVILSDTSNLDEKIETIIGSSESDNFFIPNETLINTKVALGEGNDTLTGGLEGQTIRGGNGNDQLQVAGGDNNLFGDKGNDLLVGGFFGKDTLSGGSG